MSAGSHRLHRLIRNDRWEEARDWLSSAEGAILAEEMDNEGNLPLHLALQRSKLHHSAVALVALLVKKNPTCLEHRNARGSLPIHVAAAAAGFDAVKFLSNSHPRGLGETNAAGDLPLHIAARAMTSAETVRWLAERYPEALKMVDSKGNLPLHIILQQKYYSSHTAGGNGVGDLVKAFVEGHPQSTQSQNQEGDLPVHLALRHRSEPTVRYLVDKYPECVRVKGRTGCLPLHLATWGHSDFARPFFELHPAALGIENENGVLPLHTAAFNNNEIALEFADKYPAGLRHKDKVGNLPIHEAARSAKSLQLIKALAERYPEGLDEANNDGLTPVVVACEDRLPKYRLDVVKIMMNVRKEALDRKKEEQGETPEQKLATAEKDMEGLRRQIDELKNSVALEKKNTANVQRDLDGSRDTVVEKDTQIQRLRTSLSAIVGGKRDGLGENGADAVVAEADAGSDNDGSSRVEALRDALAAATKDREQMEQELDRTKQTSAETNTVQKRRIDVLETQLKSVMEEKDRMWKELDTTKEVATDTVLSYRRTINELRTFLTSLQSEVATLKIAAMEGRKSELLLLAPVLRPGSDEGAPNNSLLVVARSLYNRLGAVGGQINPDGRPSLTRAMFPSFVKDPDPPQSSLLQVIDALSAELEVLENRYFAAVGKGPSMAEAVAESGTDGTLNGTAATLQQPTASISGKRTQSATVVAEVVHSSTLVSPSPTDKRQRT